MGQIVLLLGPKLAGQEILKARLIKEQHYNFHEIIMATTRPRRDDEIEGEKHHFINEEQLNQIIAQNQVVEMKKIETSNGNYYYLTNSKNIDLENNNYLGTNTLEGLDQYIEYYGKDLIIPIFIRSDRGSRLQLLLNHERKQVIPNYAKMCQGYLDDASLFSEENIVKRNIIDIVDNNDDIEDMILQTKIILAKRLY